uniref:Uncharacterized protein n=1 Tax=viral metagenome TaxID=1070528 RepID=A0A6C0L3S9_9ZZZZ|tara:strand:+ start:2346 stop:2714 length:369 start_codon:yes stop_codon:yes gene_type:complete
MENNLNTPPSTPVRSSYRTPPRSSNTNIPPHAPTKKRPAPKVSQEEKDILLAIENIKESLDVKVPPEIREQIIEFLETDLMRLAKKSRKINSGFKKNSYGGRKTRKKTNSKRKSQKLRYKKN